MAKLERIEAILSFWFDGDRGRWWTRSEALDAQIRDEFGDDFEAACRKELARWCEAARGRLAVVILLDQFSRNLRRDDGAAWANDPEAQKLVVRGCENGHELELSGWHRYFFYMPLMHAENLDLQNLGVARFEALAQEFPECSGAVKFAALHRDIIARFGRFPHRNQLLGRETTTEEQAYLDGGGATFGVTQSKGS